MERVSGQSIAKSTARIRTIQANYLVENGEHTPAACGLRRRAANFTPTGVLQQTVRRLVGTKPKARRPWPHAGRMRSPIFNRIIPLSARRTDSIPIPDLFRRRRGWFYIVSREGTHRVFDNILWSNGRTRIRIQHPWLPGHPIGPVDFAGLVPPDKSPFLIRTRHPCNKADTNRSTRFGSTAFAQCPLILNSDPTMNPSAAPKNSATFPWVTPEPR